MKHWVRYFSLLFYIHMFFSASLFATEEINFIRVLMPHSNFPTTGVDPRFDVVGVKISNPDNTDRTLFLHWPKNDGDFSKIDYYYSSSIPSYIIDQFGYQTIVKNSFQTWEDIPTAAIKFNFAGFNTFNPPWAVDGKNVVSFAFNDELAGFADQELLGKTLITWASQQAQVNDPSTSQNTELIDCDIILNASLFTQGGQYTWSLDTMDFSTKTIDIQSVLTHEIGHLLGIAHPYTAFTLPNPNDLPLTTTPTMYNTLSPRFTDNLNMRTLEAFDINSASFLYPVLSDGNDIWEDADPIGKGLLTDVSITPNDYDWYVTFLEAYDTIKVVIQFPNNDLDLFLTSNPVVFDPDSPVEDISEYPGAQVRADSDTFNFSTFNEYVYAHTVTQAGNYYILVKGKFETSAADYTLNLYVSKDGDGDENASNKLAPIPTGDGMNDSWEVAHNLDPTTLSDAIEDPDNDVLNSLDEFNLGSDPNNPDTDLDEMPDGWEVNNNLNLLVNDATDDKDNDGLINVAEYIAHTNPNDPNSFFKINGIVFTVNETGLGASNGMTITWLQQPSVVYEILYTDDISLDFHLLEEFLPGNEFANGIMTNTYLDKGYPFPENPNAGSIRPAPQSKDKRLYRVRVKTN